MKDEQAYLEDADYRDRVDTWNGVSMALTIGTVGCALLLVLMALFLV